MPQSILPSYTKARAGKLSSLGIECLAWPCPVKIYWMNSFCAEEKNYPISRALHMHTFYEAHFILHGSMSYATEDGMFFDLRPGDGVLFAPLVKHIVRSTDETLVKISLTFLPEEGTMLEEYLCTSEALGFALDRQMCGDLDGILIQGSARDELSAAIVQNCLSNLICRLAALAGAEKGKALGKAVSKPRETIAVTMAKQYIEDNKNRLLTCREVATQCHFNEKYFGRLFKVHTGQTLLAYIHAQKLKDAKALLADETLSLREVGERLGFANEYYFNTFFRRLSGMSPGQFSRNVFDNNAKADKKA